MTTPALNVENEEKNGPITLENVLTDSDKISTDEELSKAIDSINLSNPTENATNNVSNENLPCEIKTEEQLSKVNDSIDPPVSSENGNNEENQTKISTHTTRVTGQTAIGVKLAKKLETIANSKENKQVNGKTSATVSDNSATSSSTGTGNNETESRRIITKLTKSIMKNLSDRDPQKNLLTLATKIVELQEQQQSIQSKCNDLEKRSTSIMRERDQALLENGRVVAAKNKLESLCRELHRHNQQIREESAQRQEEDETKRRELATKFQTTIDEIAAQLSSYSEKSAALREQNAQLTEKLTNVVKQYELREREFEIALKKKELELRLTEASSEQSQTLLNERNELIKQEQQVCEAERLVLSKKCEELTASESDLRSQVQKYSERYQEFQRAIQESSQMVMTCHGEIEKLGRRIKKLEKERNDFRHRWEIAELNYRKTNEEYKLLEKEKHQAESKLDKLDKLSRVLQQERSELNATVKNLLKPPTPAVENLSSQQEVNGNEQPKTNPLPSDSPNLYDSELGRIAKTVD